MKTILHLVDDQKPGGVQRLLKYLKDDPVLAAYATHEIAFIRRGSWRPPRQKADAVVSHLSICWRNFPLFVSLRAAFAQAPLIHVEHSYSEGFMRHNVRRAERFKALLTGSYAVFDRVVAVSRGQSAWLAALGVTPDQKLRSIPSCVDLSEFLALPPKRRESRLALGAIGRLDRQKGFDVLVKAMKDVGPDMASLRIWGEGPERNVLETLSDELPHVTLMGHAADPIDAYRQSDAIIIPSRWEPYGLVALEARAAARPILVTEVDGLPEQARDGGMYVRADADTTLLASAIRDLAATDLSALRDGARFSAEGAEDAFANGWGQLLEEVFSTRFSQEENAA